MAEKKKSRKVLVEASELNDQQLNKALDDALDDLLGPEGEDDIEETSAAKPESELKSKPDRARKNK